MKRKRFSVEQIVGILEQAEVGVPVAEVIRKAGIAEQTFYRWKKMEEAVCRAGGGSGASTQATAGREHETEAVGR